MPIDYVVTVGYLGSGSYTYTAPTPSAVLRPDVDYQVGVDPFIAAGLTLTTVLPNTSGTGWTADGQGNVTVTGAGTTLFGLDIATGYVKVQAANCTIDRCMVRGYNETNQLATKGIVDGNNQAATGLLIRDTTIDPTFPGAAWDGVMGHDFTATRVKIRDVTDCFGIYNNNTGHQTDAVHVLIDGCSGDLMWFVSPDANHPGDSPISSSHNDWVQTQGAGPGSSIEIRYSNMQAWCDPASDIKYSATNRNTRGGYNAKWPTTQATSGMMITPNVTTIGGFNVHHNWMGGGQYFVNTAASQPYTAFGSISNNIFTDRLQNAGRQISIPASAGGVTTTGNTFQDDGSAVPVVRF